MQTFSGIWSVDSLNTISSENDPFYQTMGTSESPHFLDFNLSSQVIQKKMGPATPLYSLIHNLNMP
jgi:hypothetical protein